MESKKTRWPLKALEFDLFYHDIAHLLPNSSHRDRWYEIQCLPQLQGASRRYISSIMVTLAKSNSLHIIARIVLN